MVWKWLWDRKISEIQRNEEIISRKYWHLKILIILLFRFVTNTTLCSQAKRSIEGTPMIIKPTPIAAFAAVIMLSGPASAWQETAHPSIGTLQTGGSGVQTYTNPQSAGTLSGVTFPETGTTYRPANPSWGGIAPGYGKPHPTGWGTTWTTIESTPAPAGTGFETIVVVPA